MRIFKITDTYKVLLNDSDKAIKERKALSLTMFKVSELESEKAVVDGLYPKIQVVNTFYARGADFAGPVYPNICDCLPAGIFYLGKTFDEAVEQLKKIYS